MWKREDIAWAAGLIEGEGTFVGPYLAIQVLMTDYDVLEKLKIVFGLGNITKQTRKTSNDKSIYVWHVSGVDAYAVMMAIFQFLGSRRKEKIKEKLAGWKNISYRTPKRLIECLN